MPLTKISANVVLKNEDALAQMGDRVKNLRPLWNEIVVNWIDHNADKFDRARGAQATGVIFDTEGDPVTWLPLTPGYDAAKRRAGYADWLMVQSGETMRSLTERDSFGWFEDLRPDGAEFGTIIDTARWNEEKRPLMFLDADDRKMIRELFGAWLSSDAPFRPPLSRTGKVAKWAAFHLAFKMLTGSWGPLGLAIRGVKAYSAYRISKRMTR